MAESNRVFAVLGVTGNTGSAVANAMLAGGHAVRVIVREAAKGAAWKAKGATVAVADIENRAALATALRGTAGVYLMLPPPGFTASGIAEDRATKIAAMAGAVADAKPAHVLALSSAGAQHPAGTGRIADLHALETALAKTGVPTTFLRAGNFMENWASQIPGALATGNLPYASHASYKFPQVAAEDVGKTAARLLVDGDAPRGTKVVQIAGPRDESAEDVAQILSRLSGKPVHVLEVAPAAVAKALTGMGASREFADGMSGIMEGLRAGLIVWTSGNVLRGDITLEERLAAMMPPAPAAS
jgi:uncharacterized protein YbjT (DUF2867 family)